MTFLNKKERELRRETIRAALTTDAGIDAAVALIDAHQDAWDINDSDAQDREHEALNAFAAALGYGEDDE